jgi:hypothetical protein
MDYSAFRAVSDISAALVCRVCSKALEGARTFPCGHHFCSECAIESVNETNGCFACGAPFHARDARDDHILRAIVSLSVELTRIVADITRESAVSAQVTDALKKTRVVALASASDDIALHVDALPPVEAKKLAASEPPASAAKAFASPDVSEHHAQSPESSAAFDPAAAAAVPPSTVGGSPIHEVSPTLLPTLAHFDVPATISSTAGGDVPSRRGAPASNSAPAALRRNEQPAKNNEYIVAPARLGVLRSRNDANEAGTRESSAKRPRALVDSNTVGATATSGGGGSPGLSQQISAPDTAQQGAQSGICPGTAALAAAAAVPRGVALKPSSILVCGSNLDSTQQRMLARAARLLGRDAKISDEVTAETTHLVACAARGSSDPAIVKRTLKYALVVLRGGWVVTPAWLQETVNRGSRASEAPFEVKGTMQHVGAPSRARAAAASGAAGLFSGFRVQIPKRQNLNFVPLRALSHADVEALVRAGGGTVAEEGPGAAPPLGYAKTPGVTIAVFCLEADCVVGSEGEKEVRWTTTERDKLVAACKAVGVPAVDPQWLLDCASRYERLDCSDYGAR